MTELPQGGAQQLEHNHDDELVKGSTIVAVENDIAIELNTGEEAEEVPSTVGVADNNSVGDEKTASVDPEVGENLADATDAGNVEGNVDSAQLVDDESKHRWIKRRINWSRLLAFGVLPALVLLLTLGAAFLRWQDSSIRYADATRIESVKAARDSTIAILSYQPDAAEQQLGAARNLLTGSFRGSYDALVHDVVIPGAKQRAISAVATVPAVASVSASPNHAVTLVFVNQTVIVGNSAPTDTASTVRVTLDNVDGRWLISGFDPI